MTSQRDETRRTAGDEMTDDPIIIERHDEIVTGDLPVDGDPVAGDRGWRPCGCCRPGRGRRGRDGRR